MASRLHQRNARDALFSNYDPQNRSSRPSSAAASPARPSSRNTTYSTLHGNNSSPYTFTSQPNDSASSLGAKPPPNAAFSAYPGGGATSDVTARRSGDGGFRPASPDKKGRYADSVYNELESQNDEQVGMMTEKVKMLKNITIAIGDEIRDSTAFAEKMNDSFEGTRNRLRGTMNRMIRMAEKTGVGWRVWLGFFAFVLLIFFYVRFF